MKNIELDGRKVRMQIVNIFYNSVGYCWTGQIQNNYINLLQVFIKNYSEVLME